MPVSSNNFWDLWCNRWEEKQGSSKGAKKLWIEICLELPRQYSDVKTAY
jgi:hypothetical protein